MHQTESIDRTFSLRVIASAVLFLSLITANYAFASTCEEALLPDGTKIRLTSQEWNQTIGHTWGAVLERSGLDIDGTILEVAPGVQEKIGLGLADIGFRGTLFVLEPHGDSLKVITQKYEELLPFAEIIPVKATLEQFIASTRKSAKVQFEAILSNHPIDDMILDATLRDDEKEYFFSNVYERSQESLTKKLWQRMRKTPELGALAARYVEISWRKAIELLHPNMMIVAQYRSFYHREIKLDFVDDLTTVVVERLQDSIGRPDRATARVLTREGQNAQDWVYFSKRLTNDKSTLRWRKEVNSILTEAAELPEKYAKYSISALAQKLGRISAFDQNRQTDMIMALRKVCEALSRAGEFQAAQVLLINAQHLQRYKIMARTLGVPDRFVTKVAMTQRHLLEASTLSPLSVQQQLRELGFIPK